MDVVKIGRTHLQDATPLTVGQEWSGYAAQIEDALALVRQSLQRLYQLAIGGTAVGTGLNAPPDFGEKGRGRDRPAHRAAVHHGPQQIRGPGLCGRNGGGSAALRSLAVALMKIANDLRWLGSGPRAGIHELNLPANEPGSSIMPGKVNPTQREAMVMVCIQVIGEDNAVAFAGSQGNFELNTMRPIIINNVLRSARILGDACVKLREYSVEGITSTGAGYEKVLTSRFHAGDRAQPRHRL